MQLTSRINRVSFDVRIVCGLKGIKKCSSDVDSGYAFRLKALEFDELKMSMRYLMSIYSPF